MSPDQGIRVKVNATLAALIFTLLTGAAGVVWSAAKLTTAVESFRQTSSDLRYTLNAVTTSVQDLRERVGVLEDRSVRPSYPHSMIPRTRRAP